MASEWQQWYKHKIDAWQGSATIQTFTDAAYRAYHNLIMAQFQQEDGMLPSDDLRLAKMSRAGSHWSEPRDGLTTIAEEVRSALTSAENGRLYSPTQYRIWCDARDKHLECVERMERLNLGKRDKPQPPGNDSRIDARSEQRIGTRPEGGTCNATRGRERNESKSERKDSCAEPSSLPPCKQSLRLPLVDGTEYRIEEARLDAWEKTFPAVDVMHHLQRMHEWLEANPRHKKTRNGIQRFIVNWLSKEQDKARPMAETMKGANSRGQHRSDANTEAARRAMEILGGGGNDKNGGATASNTQREGSCTLH